MTVATSALPQTQTAPLRLNPWQQWRYFKETRATQAWLRQRFGDLASVHFQGQDYFLVMTPESARAVFTIDPDFYDAFWKESFSGMNGKESLWVLIGERHRRERLLFAPAVHANHFRQYGEVIRDIVRSNLEDWQPGQTIRTIDTTLSIALDVIMRLVFGVEDEQVMAEGRKVIAALTSTAHPLIVFFPKLQRNWFPLFQRYTRAKTNLYAWFMRVITERRTQGNKTMDVLGVLLNARDEEGRPFTDEHICNELLSILTAGHVTTAVAMAWALYELGRHPDVLEKLRAELESLGTEAGPDLFITQPYLSAICSETIRLHPILAECARVPMQPIEIRGRTIPAGSALVVSIVGIHHDPVTYPEPDRFRPERFLERKYSIYEFLPFGGSHRRCLGSGLAEYTLRIALAEIALHWDFETAGVDYDIRHDLAMGPKYGVPLRIEGRRQTV